MKVFLAFVYYLVKSYQLPHILVTPQTEEHLRTAEAETTGQHLQIAAASGH